MSAFVYVNGTHLPVVRIRLRANGDDGISGLSQSADGTGAQGAITVEDTTDDLTAQGFLPVVVNEPDCTSAPRLFTGYMADQDWGRGQHYLIGGQRQVDITVNDPNVLLEMCALTGTSAKRPAETDTARLAWLLSTDALGGLIHDVGWMNPIGRMYDKTDFTNQFPADVLNDLASPRDYTYFVQWDNISNRLGLFYDVPSATTYTSTLTFSNDETDWTLVNGEPSGTAMEGHAAHVVSDPSDSVYCQIVYIYAGGRLVVHSDVTHAAYFSFLGSTMHRTKVLENDRVGLRSTASTFANQALAFYSGDRQTVSFSTRLPSTKIGLIQAGMRVGLKFTHLPNLTSLAYRRVESLTIAPTEGDPSHYDVDITASERGIGFSPGTGGGTSTPPPPNDFPHQPPVATHFYSGNLVFQSDGYGTAHLTGTGAVIPNTTTGSTNEASMTWVKDQPYNYTFIINMTGGDNPPAVGLLDESGNAVSHGFPSITGVGTGTQTFTGTFTPTDDGIVAYAYFGCGALGHPPGGRTTTGSWIVDPVGWDDGTGDTAPLPGQEEPLDTVTPDPDGVTTVFNTTSGNAFAADSLHVAMNGVELERDVDYTESDNTTGEVTFTDAPPTGANITLWYVGAP